MARIIQFAQALLEEPAQEPESVAQMRKLANSEDVRLLLGDFLLRAAAAEPATEEKPHERLLDKIVGAKEVPGEEQVRILMANMDELRFYDLAVERKERFRAMARGTCHGWDLFEPQAAPAAPATPFIKD